MIAKCKICDGKSIGELVINIVGDEKVKSVALGEAMLIHFQTYHPKYVRRLAEISRIFSGFIITNRFVIDDKKTEEEKEEMRDLLADRIMEDAPEMEEDENDDDIEDDDYNSEDIDDIEEIMPDNDPARSVASVSNDNTISSLAPKDIEKRRFDQLNKK